MRTILVFGDKEFKLSVPDDARLTFGPWSPPGKGGEWDRNDKRGTLRVYGAKKDDILGVFAGVMGFRDLSLGYAEKVAKEEGAVIWKDDKDGYVREEKVSRTAAWQLEEAHPDD